MKRSEIIIAPSLLAANHACFGREAERSGSSGADRLHLDIMDGHFVPNISFGPQVVKAIRPFTKLFFDIHLMCSKPEVLLEAFAKAGADEMIVHIELAHQVPSLIKKIRSLGKKVGLAISPPTRINAVQGFLDQIDLLLVMTVNPGFGGQEFIQEILPKLQKAATWRRERKLSYRIGVDGGIDNETAAECARVGADTFVAGTSLFGARNLKGSIAKMRDIVTKADPRLAPVDASVAH
ncbi:MAG: ribulose-phosphate 3-epimerase [Methylacidiphilales bacterium]|nr:ribulose-phosphate 3-epimerase [Candidatus Methylacidiphilales bacterium]